jgi:hypothetical protein
MVLPSASFVGILTMYLANLSMERDKLFLKMGLLVSRHECRYHYLPAQKNGQEGGTKEMEGPLCRTFPLSDY